MDLNGGIANIRDFLVHLPRLARYDYDEAVSYMVWKVLSLSVEQGGERIDWGSIVNVMGSPKWRDGTYRSVLKDCSWKHKALETARKGHSHAGTMCNRQCYPPETVYYCFTCTMNPLYEICEYCFDKSRHEGHVYTAKMVVRPEGRVCHCGNTFVFPESHCLSQCKEEQNNACPEASESQDSFEEHIVPTVSAVCNYLIDITVYFQEKEGLASPLDNACYGRSRFDPSAKPEIYLEDSRGNICDRIPEDETEWALQIDEEDCQMCYMDLAAKIGRILNKPLEYAVSITSVLENGGPSVTVVKSRDRTKIEKISSKFTSEGATNHIRETKDTFKKSLVDDLVHWLYLFSIKEANSLQIKKALRLSFLEAWEPGLVSNKLALDCLNPFMSKINLLGGFLISEEQRDTFPWFTPWEFSDINDLSVREILLKYNKRLASTNIPNAVSRYHTLHGSRLQYILVGLADILTKLSKNRMLKVISSLFAIMDNTKQFLASQYLDVYLAVLYSTVASDLTGFKVSLMGTLSQHIFQDPRNANLAIRRGFIQRTLRFAFTLMAFSPEDLSAYLPIPLYYSCKLPSESIRNRRTIICLKDICMLMSTNTIPDELLKDEEILAVIIESFAAFNKILPLKRETSEHVEFENFDFSSYYFFFSSILVLTDGYVHSISLLSDLESRRGFISKLLTIAMDKELEILSKLRRSYSNSSLSDIKCRCKLKMDGLPLVKEKICNYVGHVINFQVGVDTQNFFNPMSYLFRFVLQWSCCGKYTPLPDISRKYLDFRKLIQDKAKALYVSESALSTLVLIGQISVGFWVRNGTPITHQARMYTTYSIREFTYMSDIFNVQFSMAMADPNEFIVTYLARWGLKHWSNGFPMGDYPDFETTVAMVNQCCLLLIRLFSQTKFLTVVSSVDGFEKTLRGEIVHALCFKSCSYSQIMNSLPEHITKHAAFDLYLEKYTDFIAPAGVTDSGVYTLKTEYTNEIDPYFIGLSSSKRYEVEKSIRMSMALREKIDYEDTFIPAPKTIDSLKFTPYCELFAISSVETFGTFLKNTLDHIKKYECDTLLPTVLHLIHLCIVNNLDAFSKIFWHEFGSLDTEFCFYHSIGSILYSFLLQENCLQVHGKIREIFKYMVKNVPHVDADSYLREQVPSFDSDILWSSKAIRNNKDGELERKKNLARMKKEKMMRKLAKQQIQFIDNHNFSASDEEICKESSADSTTSSQQHLENSNEDPCVFCKMPSEDDVFVYFSYQEQNICECRVDFTTERSWNNTMTRSSEGCNFDWMKQIFNSKRTTQLTSQASVLRTCGHGSHISCLANHMKAIRATHNQTTKNIPVAFGFGLLYCPLCNALCNSFLPHLAGLEWHYSEDYSRNKSPKSTGCMESSLLSTGIKAAKVFQDLQWEPNGSTNNLADAVSYLLVNTIRNAELGLRPDDGLSMDRVSSQKLRTLELLYALRNVIKDQSVNAHPSLGDLPGWYDCLSEKFDCDLLVSGSYLIDQYISGSKEEGVEKRVGIYPPTIFHELIKRKVFRDILLISKGLVDESFRLDTLEKAVESKETDGNESRMEQSCIAMILREFSSFLEPEAERSAVSPPMVEYVHHLLIGSLTVFLRRLCIMYHIRSGPRADRNCMSASCRPVDFYICYLNLQPMRVTLQRLIDEDFDTTLNSIKQSFVGHRSQTILRTPKCMSLSSAEPLHLAPLPSSLSAFFRSEDDNITHRALKHEIAVCLFCGTACRIQKPIALHKYAIGVCTNHVRNVCPVISTYGAFLLIRSNAIYLAYGQRGSFYPAPYLHRHGEPDEDLKYNSPVYLDETRYEHLKSGVILENMIPHIVHRLTENNSDLGGWETM
ncbi:hypothetical protein HG536_0E04480 [Torulaspora globosa]|uniref:E3 ubiquitin-protein ligase n=1 Tax=Torulaspora globosa TaxID=48254 RepID=A0A7G3ZJ51_9SACH|nr:uncharacterized protein HG536_0E04480 [Torulaspora globosa]QLL33537.1 hypothetical protein HG536_0E04480 [Torulaspora globosa]